MRMINEAKEILEDLLRYNDAKREKEEDIQHQEEAYREDERISKSKEEPEEQNRQTKMYTRMNKEQQVLEDRQAAKAATEHAKEQERVHTAHKYESWVGLIFHI